MFAHSPRSRFAPLLAVALVAAGVTVLELQFPNTLGPRWLLGAAAGVPFAVGLLFGSWAALAVALGTLAANFACDLDFAPALVGAGIAAVETLVAAHWARNRLPFAPGLDGPRDVLELTYGLAAATASRGLAAAVGASLLHEPQPFSAGIAAFASGWLGGIVAAPAAVVWLRSGAVRLADSRRILEGGSAAIVVVALTWLWFGGANQFSFVLPIPALAVILALGNWVAFRFYSRGMVTLVPLVALVIAAGILTRGQVEPLIDRNTSHAETCLWLFGLGAVVVFHLILAAIAREYRLRADEREEYLLAAHLQTQRLNDVNSRLTIQSMEIADQAEMLERQRDEFEAIAAEVAEKRAWLEAVVAQLPVGALLVDADLNVVSLNERFKQILGLKFAAADSLEDFRGWPTETLDGVPIAYDDWPLPRATRGEMVIDQSMRIGRADGSAVEICVSATPIRSSAGALLGSVLLMSDLSPVRQAERAARENEERLRFALRSARMIAWDWNVRTKEMRRSDRLEDWLGLPKDPNMQEEAAFAVYLHPDDRERVLTTSARVNAGEIDDYELEYRLRRADGNILWLNSRGRRVYGTNGKPTDWVAGVIIDVTDRRRNEERLRLLESAVVHANDAVLVLEAVAADGLGRSVLYANEAFFALTGYPREEVVGRSLHYLRGPDTDVTTLDGLRIALETTVPFRAELLNYTKDGRELWVDLSLVPVAGPDGRCAHFVMIQRDVTARHRLEDQLRQSQKMEALGQLAGGIAHDFNNLLTAVLGNLSLVRLPDGDKNRPLLRTIEQAATRAADLTRKLLGYARRNQLLVAPTQPGEMIDEVVDILRRTLDPRIRIRTDVQTDVTLNVDATLINQALFNLCLNARDAMPHGGTLTLAAKAVERGEDETVENPDARPGAFVVLSIVDTGHGMSDAVRARLFEPFFTTKGVGKGTGLGLPMVHGIMRQHGGWVTVATEVDRGTCFDLYLPAADALAKTPPPVNTRMSAHELPVPTGELLDGRGTTILVVDDEPMIRALATAILQSAGYTVREAEDGQDAVDLFAREREHIALVILDLTMPRLNGRDAFRQMVAIDPDVRVLFSSGYSADEVTEIDGSAGLLSKPYRPHDLLAAVGRSLRVAVEA